MKRHILRKSFASLRNHIHAAAGTAGVALLVAAMPLTAGTLPAAAMNGSEAVSQASAVPSPTSSVASSPLPTTLTPTSLSSATSSSTRPPSAYPASPTNPSGSGANGAHMGQGAQRLKLGKNPQDITPTSQTASPQTASPMTSWMAPGTQGLDVSGWQSTESPAGSGIYYDNVDWQSQWNAGARFAYIKATEGTSGTNRVFSQQYTNATNAGMIRGGYHFALPPLSSGADQANYFLNNGGGWSGDGLTLPPLLDIEYNPYSALGDTCYNMAGSAMANWIRDFSNTILARIGRLPAIYTTQDWWNKCTGGDGGFGANPLHIAAYSTWVGNMPSGWNDYKIWQYSSSGPFAGDSNAFNGSYQDLRNFATFTNGLGATLATASGSTTVYIVNGSTKYPIPDWATYQLYQRVSPLQTVGQSYLDSLTTGRPVGRFMQASDGSIYYNNSDNGNKLHVPSCAMMADFGGGSCVNFIPLPDALINSYLDGGTLTNAVRTPSGRQYYVSNQTLREFFDAASLTTAGLQSGISSLSEASVSGFARSGTPIVRPDVILVRREDNNAFIYTQGKAIPVPASINAENLWSRSMTVGLLDGQTISQIPAGPSYQGFVTNSTGTMKYILNAQGKYTLIDAIQWPTSYVVFSDSLISKLPSQGSLNTPAYIKSDTASFVYRYASATARNVPTWATLVQLNQGSSPNITSLPPTVMKALATAPGIQPLASQVVTNASPTVFVINDVNKLVPVEDFAVSSQLAIAGYTRTDKTALTPYSADSAPLTPVVTCNSKTYLGRSSSIVQLAPAASTAQLPTTALAPSTCLALSLPSDSAPALAQQVFVKTTTSSTVYKLENGTKRPVITWSALVTANGGKPDVVIATYGPASLEAISIGAPIS